MWDRWRDAIRIICVICWLLSVLMCFVPEPERNAANKEALRQKQREIIELSNQPNSQSENDEVSLSQVSPIFTW